MCCDFKLNMLFKYKKDETNIHDSNHKLQSWTQLTISVPRPFQFTGICMKTFFTKMFAH